MAGEFFALPAPGPLRWRLGQAYADSPPAGLSYAGGALTVATFDDPVSAALTLAALPGQTYSGGAVTAQTFGS